MDLSHLPPDLREKLEDMETQYGPTAGKLAMAMDLMTEAEIAAGQLAIYCRNSMNPSKPHPDLEQVQACVKAVRQLVKGAFREERAKKAPGSAAT